MPTRQSHLIPLEFTELANELLKAIHDCLPTFFSVKSSISRRPIYEQSLGSRESWLITDKFVCVVAMGYFEWNFVGIFSKKSKVQKS
jgi:hypothetical protein